MQMLLDNSVGLNGRGVQAQTAMDWHKRFRRSGTEENFEEKLNAHIGGLSCLQLASVCERFPEFSCGPRASWQVNFALTANEPLVQVDVVPSPSPRIGNPYPSIMIIRGNGGREFLTRRKPGHRSKVFSRRDRNDLFGGKAMKPHLRALCQKRHKTGRPESGGLPEKWDSIGVSRLGGSHLAARADDVAKPAKIWQSFVNKRMVRRSFGCVIFFQRNLFW